MRRAKSFRLLAIFVLFVAGCSDDPQSNQDSGNVTSDSGAVPTVSEGQESNSGVGDIVEMLTSSDSSTDRHILHQEAIAACMRNQGFEYTPLPAPTQEVFNNGALAPVDVRREFVESYGYGVTTLYWELELEAARGRGIDSNPNEQRMSTMTDAEREAFQAALRGPVVSSDSGSEGVEGVVRDKEGSCEMQAGEEVSTGLDRNSLPDTVQQALVQTMERVYADPVVTATDDAWFNCMAEAGHEVERPPIIDGERVGPMFPTGEQIVQSLVDGLNSTADWRTLTVEHGDGTSEAVEYPVFDETALAEAREVEMTIAMADLTCDEETGRTETILSVRDALYEKVIQDNLSAFVTVISD